MRYDEAASNVLLWKLSEKRSPNTALREIIETDVMFTGTNILNASVNRDRWEELLKK